MTRIHQIRACICDLLRTSTIICYIYITAWITWLILMDLHQIFRFLDSFSEPTGNSNDPFSNVFKKSDLVEPDCLKPHLFGYSNRSSCVSGHFPCFIHGDNPGTTCAPKGIWPKKKWAGTCCFDFRSRFRCFGPWRLRGMWEMPFHSILFQSWLPLTSSWKK